MCKEAAGAADDPDKELREALDEEEDAQAKADKRGRGKGRGRGRGRGRGKKAQEEARATNEEKVEPVSSKEASKPKGRSKKRGHADLVQESVPPPGPANNLSDQAASQSAGTTGGELAKSSPKAKLRRTATRTRHKNLAKLRSMSRSPASKKIRKQAEQVSPAKAAKAVVDGGENADGGETADPAIVAKSDSDVKDKEAHRESEEQPPEPVVKGKDKELDEEKIAKKKALKEPSLVRDTCAIALHYISTPVHD